MTGIYKIQSSGGYCYIGRSIDIARRWKEHLTMATTATIEDEFHYDLKNSISNFSFTILEICEEDELPEREDFWIKMYQPYYNRIASSVNNTKIVEKAITKKDRNKIINEVIGKPLFKEDKDNLCRALGYLNSKGDIVGWPTTKKHIINSGLAIIETKRKYNGKIRNCSIITVEMED